MFPQRSSSWPKSQLRADWADFRKLYGNEEIHAGLIIIVPQVVPALQRELFTLMLEEVVGGEELLNEVIEITIEGDEAVLTRYSLPAI